MAVAGSAAAKGLSSFGSSVKSGSLKAASAISEKTSQLTLLWKDQLAKKEVGNKFKALFTKKKPAGEEGEPKPVDGDGIEEKKKVPGADAKFGPANKTIEEVFNDNDED